MKILKFTSIAFLIGFFLSLLTVKCSAQDFEDDARVFDVKSFTKIYLEGGYKVYLSQADKPGLKIRTTDNEAFEYFEVSSNFGELRVTMKRHHVFLEDLTLYITVNKLEEVEIEGGVKLETKGNLKVDDLTVKVEGGAKIELDLDAKNITVVGEGGVLYDLEGLADTFDARISGAGHIDASELKTKNTTIKIEGAGTGSVYATNELWATISGVGKIKYRGEPNIHKKVDGIGVVSND